MDWLQIALRAVHIFGGIAWVGGAALFFFYLEPAINKLGPDAEKFVDEVINKRKLPIYFVAASTLTVVAGVWLYWRDSNGLQMAWISSPTGIAFTTGGIAALIAWAGGNLLIPRTLMQLNAHVTQMRAAGGPPTPEMLATLQAIQHRLRRLGLADLILLGVAVLTMAVARYLT